MVLVVAVVQQTKVHTELEQVVKVTMEEGELVDFMVLEVLAVAEALVL